MNLFSILKGILPTMPTLDEFIKIHEPSDIYTVEYLEKQYQRLYGSGA